MPPVHLPSLTTENLAFPSTGDSTSGHGFRKANTTTPIGEVILMHTYDTPRHCVEERNGCTKAATLIREIMQKKTGGEG